MIDPSKWSREELNSWIINAEKRMLELETQVRENTILPKNNMTVADKGMYDKFLAGFNKIVGSKHRGDPKSKTSLRARLKEGWTGENILKAVYAASKSPHLMGANDSNRRYLTPEYILRADKLDQWFANYEDRDKIAELTKQSHKHTN